MKILIALFLSLGMIMTANAATFYVNSRADPGDGVCDASCTLRDAIIAANADTALDIIDLSAIKNPNGPVVTIQPLSPLPPITAPVTIDGSINELRNDLPGDIVLNAGAGFSLSGSGPTKRPGVELDGSLAIASDDTQPGFYIVPALGAVSCDDPSHMAGTFCYDTDPLDPGNPDIFVFLNENKLSKVDKARVHGLWLKEHVGSTIRGLTINRFSGTGIFIDKGGHHQLYGDYLGTDVTGTKTGTQVGVPGDVGTYLTVDLNPVSSTYLWIERDMLDFGDGTIAYGNGYPNTFLVGFIGGFDGVAILNSSDNKLGHFAANDRNIISSNGDEAVEITAYEDFQSVPPLFPADRNSLKGNFMGTGVYGTEALGNFTHGPIVVNLAPPAVGSAANDNEIVGNVISDNGFSGGVGFSGSAILVFNVNTPIGPSKTRVLHNHIGTDVTGQQALGNGLDGLFSRNGSQNNFLKNVVTANARLGMFMNREVETVVSGNHVGVGIIGEIALGNADTGVLNIGGSQNIYEKNLISANALNGIEIRSGDGVIIRNNTIGSNIHKDLSNDTFANGFYGVLLLGEAVNPILGIPAKNVQIRNNFIANNKLPGITALFQEDLLIEDNVVLKNGFAKGISVPDFGQVDGLPQAGIQISDQSRRVNILNNYIGVEPSTPSDTTLGNGAEGIYIGSVVVLHAYPSILPPVFAPQHFPLFSPLTGQPVGPTEVLVEANVIAHNNGEGLLVGGDVDDSVTAFCSANLCLDTFLFLAFNVFIPTALPYDDGLPGDSMNITLLGNAIFNNDGLGIDITQAHQNVSLINRDVWTAAFVIEDGVAPNDAGDVDIGPNNLQNYPDIEEGEAVAAGNHLKKVTGTLDSLPGNYRVEFYVNENDDPSGHGEGEKFAGFIEFEIVGPGPHSFTLICKGIDAANGCPKVDVPTPLQKLNVTATATNLDTGETSEFAKNVALDTN